MGHGPQCFYAINICYLRLSPDFAPPGSLLLPDVALHGTAERRTNICMSYIYREPCLIFRTHSFLVLCIPRGLTTETYDDLPGSR